MVNMISQRSEQLRKLISAGLLITIGFLVLLTAFQKQYLDSDILWALKSGELILSNFSVPSTDPFSYTFASRPWVDFTWGFQVLVHLFFTYLGGWAGLFIFQSLVVASTFVFLYANMRITSGRRYLAIGVLFLAFVGAHSRFFIRPHLFEYFFVSLSLLLFTLYERKGRMLFLYLLLPVQVLWVNIHSSAILGIFIAFAFLGGQIIDEFRQGGFSFRADISSRVKRLFIPALLVPVVSLLNPYGLQLVIFPFVHNNPDNSDAIKHIREWMAPHLKEMLFYFFPFPLDHFAFVLIAVFIVVALALNIRRVKVRDLMLLAAGLYMALSHVRWIALFFFIAAPVLVANASAYLDSKRSDPAYLKWGAALLPVFFAVVMLYDYLGPARAPYWGLGPKHGAYPSGTVEFMKREGITGNIYNEYVFGGYLIFHYPEVKVFIDGRTPTVYSPLFFWKSRVLADPARWERLASEYGIDIALIKPADPLCANLRDDKEWKAVSFDDTSVLFLKETGRFKEIISRRGFTSLNVCSDDIKKMTVDEAVLNGSRVELKGMLADREAASYARPHRLLGFIEARLGLNIDAAEALEKSVAISPNASTYYTLGTVLGKLKKRQEALGAFESSIKIDKDHSDSWLGAGVAYYDMKKYAQAIRCLKKYISLADDSSEQLAYKTLGEAYFERAELDAAAVYLERAAFLTDDAGELADIYYTLGNVIFETGDLTSGARYYGLAMENKPDYAVVLKELAASHLASGRDDKAEGIRSVLAAHERSGK